LRRRGQQLGLVFAAALVAAAMCAGLAGFAERAGARLNEDLRAFGPNLLVRALPGSAIPIEAGTVVLVRDIAGVQAASGVVEIPAPDDGGVAVYAADEDILRLHPNWEVDPHWPRAGERGRGARLDASLGPAARISTGEAARDGSVFAPLADYAASGLRRIEVRAEPRNLHRIARAIERRVPGVEARPFERVTESERRLSGRIEWLLVCAGAISLALAVASVAASTAALLGERRRELALMLALGHPARRLLGLVAAELAFAAAAAAVLGQLAGEAGAAALARRLWGGGAFHLTPGGALAAVGVVVLVVLAGVAVAVRRIAGVEPSAVLRGE
jgi:hypothetical protein